MQNLNFQNRILLIGSGGHCHSVMDTLQHNMQYDRIGVIAKDEDIFKNLMNDRILSDYVIGTDADLPRLFQEGWNNAFVTLGSIGNPVGRKKIASVLKDIGFQLPPIIDSTAVVSEMVNIGSGVFVGKKAVINIGCNVGDCAIVNTGAIIEHDCNIGAFAHISPGTVICGQVTVGNDSHIGAGTIVRQGIRIGENALIGAGSVVVRDIPDNVKAYGNPCRVVE